MNILNNRNKRTSIFKAMALCLIAAMSFTLLSCDDDMDIQQSYPFTVEVMPVPNKVTKGQTVEIRCELKKDRLYYTAEGEEAHKFIVVVEDNFGNSFELEFGFNNRNIKDDGLTAIPIGNFRPLLK